MFPIFWTVCEQQSKPLIDVWMYMFDCKHPPNKRQWNSKSFSASFLFSYISSHIKKKKTVRYSEFEHLRAIFAFTLCTDDTVESPDCFLHKGMTFFLCPHYIVHILMIQLCESSFLRLKKCFLFQKMRIWKVVSHNLLSKNFFHVLTVLTRVYFFCAIFFWLPATK